jgi:hypothetical protein
VSTNEAFCELLASHFQGVGAILEEHREDNGELLPHVFFGELTRYVLSDGPDRVAVVQCIENAMSTETPSVCELIAVSFVENIEAKDELSKILAEVAGNQSGGVAWTVWSSGLTPMPRPASPYVWSLIVLEHDLLPVLNGLGRNIVRFYEY